MFSELAAEDCRTYWKMEKMSNKRRGIYAERTYQQAVGDEPGSGHYRCLEASRKCRGSLAEGGSVYVKVVEPRTMRFPTIESCPSFRRLTIGWYHYLRILQVPRWTSLKSAF